MTESSISRVRTARRLGPRAGVSDAVVAGPVPGQVQFGEDVLTVERAWPRGRRDGAEVILVEGHDRSGRLRAARLRLRPSTGLGWHVSTIQVAPPGDDPKLPDLHEASRGGRLVVHRYGRRAVVRCADRVVKVVRPGDGPVIASAARQGEQMAVAAGFTAPEVLRTGRGQVSFSILPGRSLHELGGVVPRREWSRWWAHWATLWTALAQPSGVHRLPDHSAHDEAVVLRRWLERVIRLEALPTGLSHQVTSRADAVITDLVTQPAQALVLSHRDLHDKQMLAHERSLGLLDFDTVALAEPALDLANLWVHAQLRADQGLWSRGHSEVAQRAIREVARDLAVSDDRFATYAEASRLRLACLYAFRPRYRDLALAWAAV